MENKSTKKCKRSKFWVGIYSNADIEVNEKKIFNWIFGKILLLQEKIIEVNDQWKT